MSVSSEITRLQTARNTLRNKAVDLGIANNTDKLDALASAYDGIVNRGAISASVQEGDTYTIPQGYHNGTGTVSGVAGGGNYSLQAKGPITPTKSQQNITPDNGWYGLSGVTIGAIPSAYQDVSSVTAVASHILANDIAVDSSGTVIAGTMPNNGAVSKVLDATSGNQSYAVPTGYHNGLGTVSIVLESKSATPSTATQTIAPSSGKVLNKVTIDPIPSAYQNVSNVTATASDVKDGIIIVDATGAEITGTMPIIASSSKTLDATTNNQSYTIPSGYHDGTGIVKVVLEEKSFTPTTSSTNITPTSGKVLSKVTVAAIPSKYGDVSSDTATASDLLYGVKAHTIVNGAAVQITGEMPNNGAISGSIDGLTTMTYAVSSGYTSGGTVTLTSDIETALAAI